ncbi:hypothetical protein [Carnimonas bestiolae]|uniref:hypothetical protein n=1 Tax=Carnimonas bestiolae TaxID=3402172 RepID=UPI003EDC1E39
MSSILYEDKNILITHHKDAFSDPQKPIVISFGTIRDDKAPEGFGTKFLLKNGYENIYVSQSRYTHFQSLSRKLLKKKISSVVRGRKIFTFGTSIGGYAALYYGDYLDANILAFAPRLSIHPDVIRAHPQVNKNTYVKYSRTLYLHSDIKKVNYNDNVTIVYDGKLEEDAFFFNKKVKPYFANATVYRLENNSHDIPALLKEAGILSSFVKSVFSGSSDVSCDIDYSSTKIVKRIRSRELREEGRFEECYQVTLALLEDNPTLEDFKLYKELVCRDIGDIKVKRFTMPKRLRKILINRSSLSAKQAVEPNKLLKQEIGLFTDILDFESAKALASIGETIFEDDSFFRRRRKMLESMLNRF